MTSLAILLSSFSEFFENPELYYVFFTLKCYLENFLILQEPSKPLLLMGRVMGIEPTTSSSTNWRSNQLSYTRHRDKFNLLKFFSLRQERVCFDHTYFLLEILEDSS